jgi:hypothetical protein
MNPGRLLLLLLGVLSATLAGQAQPRDQEHEHEHGRGRDRGRGPRVIVYQDAEYRGDSLVLYPGDSLENLSGLTFENGGRLNDRISSIRVEGGAELYVHADARFRGAVMRVTENTRDLTGRLLPGSGSTSWNDRISSLRVEMRRRDEARPDPDVIIQRAYRDLLGREPDSAGFRDYRILIIDQGWTEGMVRDHVRRSDEYRRKTGGR